MVPTSETMPRLLAEEDGSGRRQTTELSDATASGSILPYGLYLGWLRERYTVLLVVAVAFALVFSPRQEYLVTIDIILMSHHHQT